MYGKCATTNEWKRELSYVTGFSIAVQCQSKSLVIRTCRRRYWTALAIDDHLIGLTINDHLLNDHLSLCVTHIVYYVRARVTSEVHYTLPY